MKMPEALENLVFPLVADARSQLEAGEPIRPMAYVGNLETKKLEILPFSTSDEAEKSRSAERIRIVARLLNADFVMTIMESYALRPEKMPKLQAILDEYSSLANCPASWRMDVISVIIEMPGEMWAAQPEIKPKGISKKKRTIGEPEFRRFDGAAGRFADLLPIKSAGSTVH